MAESDLDRALGSSTRILLDSSALIAFHSSREEVHVLARHLLARIEDDADALTGYYSAVSAMELLVRPMRLGEATAAFMYTFLTAYPNLSHVPVTLDVATEAARLRVAAGVKGSDALIVASGLQAGCEAIVSNDEAWSKSLRSRFGHIAWIHLQDYLS